MVLRVVSAQIGHATKCEIFAISFDALELLVVVVYKPDWLIARVRSFRTAGMFCSGSWNRWSWLRMLREGRRNRRRLEMGDLNSELC